MPINHYRCNLMMNICSGKAWIFSFLMMLFIVYSVLVYTRGTEPKSLPVKMSDKAVKGKMTWQKHNCIACHQFYGLGGYLGPDLTNVISAKGKEKPYVRAILKNGLLNMPDFHLTDREIDGLVAYLAQVDKTGKYPDKDVDMTWYGSFYLQKNRK